MSKRVRIIFGGILLALMSAYFGLHVYSVTLPMKGSSAGIHTRWDGKSDPRIDGVDPTGVAAGFQVGDELVAIDGVKIKDDPRVLIANDQPPGTLSTITIRRRGQLRDVTFRTIPRSERERFDPINYISLLFLLTAWLVFLLRPGDKQAWLLALMLATLTGLLGSTPGNLPSWLTPVIDASLITGLLFLPVFVHFFLIFPGRSPLLRRWPRLEILVYLPFLFVLLPFLGPSRSKSPSVKAWVLQSDWFQNFIDAAVCVVLAYLAAGLACLIINYQAESIINRRRLRVVMAGSTGFFNLFLWIMGAESGLSNKKPGLWSWLGKGLYITLPLIPLSFVYAIVRHKVIPVSLIIRRGLRYLLVSRGSVLLLMAAVCVMTFFVMDAFFAYLKPKSGRTIGIISAIVAITVWQLALAFHLRVIAPKIDQLFFHQAYDTQQIIADLAESLRATTSLPQLLELVATKIQSALHAANVTILLRDGENGDYKCAYSCVYSFHNRSVAPNPCYVGLTRESALIRRLAETAQPIDLEGVESQFAPHSENGGSSSLSNEECEALLKLESAMLLPIVGKEGLLGVVSLGSHIGDLPYSSEDKRLLLSVGGPASFALENTRLIERTVADARRRQELEAENEQRAKELEEARQLQFSMLPKRIPQLPHLEIAAHMTTATEVGGDYYDFHLSDDGALTVAVGDATGHGLKAGTVVTAMKSLFHCYAGEPELTALLAQSSRVLKKMNLRSMFMGLTVAKLTGRQLRISAAGMPPALVFRAKDGTVEEVLIKAMPLGSVSGYPYRELQLTLSCGDVVVLMSDGLPERFNRAGEMFDYSRTKELLARVASLAPGEIIERMVDAGEAWAEGRPQDDDMTFVALKVKL